MILVALLFNKKIADKEQVMEIADHNNSRNVSSFSGKNHFLNKRNISLKIQNPEELKITSRKLPLLLNEKSFNQLKPPEESREKVMVEFSLFNEKSILLPNYFKSSLVGSNPLVKNSITRGFNPITIKSSGLGLIPVTEL